MKGGMRDLRIEEETEADQYSYILFSVPHLLLLPLNSPLSRFSSHTFSKERIQSAGICPMIEDRSFF